MRNILLLIILVSFVISAPAQKVDDVWKPFKYFVGKWRAEQDGINSWREEFQFILRGKFLHMKNKTDFKPTAENPKGEVHEDWGVFSYDVMRKTFVFRQFHVEGFVNQYVLDSISKDGKTMVFITENVENAPPGTKAKLTLIKINFNEFRQKFDVSWPGREYQCFGEGVFKRKK